MEQSVGKKSVSKNQVEDIVCEIGNIGAGSCMASLSHMTGKMVTCSAPVVMEMDYNRVADWFGPADESVVGVMVPFSGDITGLLLQVYKMDMVSVILEGVLERQPEQEELDGRLLDLLKEIANITSSTYLTSLSSCTGCKIDVQDSAVSMDMEGAIVTELIGAAANIYGLAVCIGNKFHIGEDSGESCLCMILHGDSVGRFIDAMEVGL